MKMKEMNGMQVLFLSVRETSHFTSLANLCFVFQLNRTTMLATVGTIGAVLAGLDITMFIEFTPHDDSTWVSYSIHLPKLVLKF